MNDTINDYMLYKKMYYKLFIAVTDALNESNALSKENILKKSSTRVRGYVYKL